MLSDYPASPFVRNLVEKFGTSDEYIGDLVALDAALRGPAPPPDDLERRYPLEALIVRHELASGRATTHWELSLLKARAAELSARTLLERRPWRAGRGAPIYPSWTFAAQPGRLRRHAR